MNPIDEDLFEKPKNRIPWLRTMGLWTIAFLAGYAFKLLHWWGADFLILISTGGPMAFLLFTLFVRKRESIWLYVLLALSSGWAIYLFWGAMYKGGRPYNVDGLWLYFVIVVIWFVGYAAAYNYKKR